MTEALKHECGIAMIRLLKPLEYYQQKYGTWQYGLNKLYLLMEKQHNRGQEGAGLAVVKTDSIPGREFIFRERATGSGAISEIFANVYANYENVPKQCLDDVFYAKENLPFAGELYLGHLRYSTTGRSGISYVHPFLRRNNWRSRNLALAGNFNMTNVDELYQSLLEEGQHPRDYADTFVMLETLGHSLDREVQFQYDKATKAQPSLKGEDLNIEIEKQMDISHLLKSSSQKWDGGFVICGLIGSGDSFAYRDPWGIRPAFYYHDDEIIVVASERPVIQTAMNVDVDDVKELNPGQAIIIKKDGGFTLSQIRTEDKVTPCSFERIYFSRGSDKDIYEERKQLGGLLLPSILKSINNDLRNTVFSFIPNTSEVAFFGMIDYFHKYLDEVKLKKIRDRGRDITDEELKKILSIKIRSEKIVIKDIKLRTFIAQDKSRNDLAAHVYDVTYNSIKPGVDNIVVIDDSIVRGTTLKQSIIKMLDRLHPKKIVVVSSSPQIRYPDCYGIDMSRMTEFAAFRAAIELLKDNNMQHVIDEVYKKSAAQRNKPKEEIVNYVKDIYAPFTDEQISKKIAQMLTPQGTEAEVELVFQTVEDLHKACPNHSGDWYFSGNYPTPGGNRLVNTAFLNYIEGTDKRYY